MEWEYWGDRKPASPPRKGSSLTFPTLTPPPWSEGSASLSKSLVSNTSGPAATEATRLATAPPQDGKHLQSNARSQRPRNKVKYKDSLEHLEGSAIDYVKLSAAILDGGFNSLESTLKPEELTVDLLHQDGFRQPLCVKSTGSKAATLKALGMKLPRQALTAGSIAAAVGPRRKVHTIDVATQAAGPRMRLQDWVAYLASPAARARQLLNVVSLSLADTPLQEQVVAPAAVREVDLVHQVWPAGEAPCPEVLLYALMGPAGSFTDFHIDFGGSSVWYHVVLGSKVFLAVPPTPRNLSLFEDWASSEKQTACFLGDVAEGAVRIRVGEGETLLIPSGWPHAVVTPEDSVVVGGNFLHGLDFRMQLAVWEMESRLGVGAKFRFPLFKPLMWHCAAHYLTLLQDIIRSGWRPQAMAVSRWEIDGLLELLMALRQWAVRTRRRDNSTVPACISDCNGLLGELSECIEAVSQDWASSQAGGDPAPPKAFLHPLAAADTATAAGAADPPFSQPPEASMDLPFAGTSALPAPASAQAELPHKGAVQPPMPDVIADSSRSTLRDAPPPLSASAERDDAAADAANATAQSRGPGSEPEDAFMEGLADLGTLGAVPTGQELSHLDVADAGIGLLYGDAIWYDDEMLHNQLPEEAVLPLADLEEQQAVSEPDSGASPSSLEASSADSESGSDSSWGGKARSSKRSRESAHTAARSSPSSSKAPAGKRRKAAPISSDDNSTDGELPTSAAHANGKPQARRAAGTLRRSTTRAAGKTARKQQSGKRVTQPPLPAESHVKPAAVPPQVAVFRPGEVRQQQAAPARKAAGPEGRKAAAVALLQTKLARERALKARVDSGQLRLADGGTRIMQRIAELEAELKRSQPGVPTAAKLVAPSVSQGYSYMDERGQRQGPFTVSQLQLLFKTAVVDRHTLILHPVHRTRPLRALLSAMELSQRATPNGSARSEGAAASQQSVRVRLQQAAKPPQSGQRNLPPQSRCPPKPPMGARNGFMAGRRPMNVSRAPERKPAFPKGAQRGQGQQQHARSQERRGKEDGWATKSAASILAEVDTIIEDLDSQGAWSFRNADGKYEGPYTVGELRAFLRRDDIASSTLVHDEEEGLTMQLSVLLGSSARLPPAPASLPRSSRASTAGHEASAAPDGGVNVSELQRSPSPLSVESLASDMDTDSDERVPPPPPPSPPPKLSNATPSLRSGAAPAAAPLTPLASQPPVQPQAHRPAAAAWGTEEAELLAAAEAHTASLQLPSAPYCNPPAACEPRSTMPAVGHHEQAHLPMPAAAAPRTACSQANGRGSPRSIQAPPWQRAQPQMFAEQQHINAAQALPGGPQPAAIRAADSQLVLPPSSLLLQADAAAQRITSPSLQHNGEPSEEQVATELSVKHHHHMPPRGQWGDCSMSQPSPQLCSPSSHPPNAVPNSCQPSPTPHAVPNASQLPQHAAVSTQEVAGATPATVPALGWQELQELLSSLGATAPSPASQPGGPAVASSPQLLQDQLPVQQAAAPAGAQVLPQLAPVQKAAPPRAQLPPPQQIPPSPAQLPPQQLPHPMHLHPQLNAAPARQPQLSAAIAPQQLLLQAQPTQPQAQAPGRIPTSVGPMRRDAALTEALLPGPPGEQPLQQQQMVREAPPWRRQPEEVLKPAQARSEGCTVEIEDAPTGRFHNLPGAGQSYLLQQPADMPAAFGMEGDTSTNSAASGAYPPRSSHTAAEHVPYSINGSDQRRSAHPWPAQQRSSCDAQAHMHGRDARPAGPQPKPMRRWDEGQAGRPDVRLEAEAGARWEERHRGAVQPPRGRAQGGRREDANRGSPQGSDRRWQPRPGAGSPRGRLPPPMRRKTQHHEAARHHHYRNRAGERDSPRRHLDHGQQDHKQLGREGAGLQGAQGRAERDVQGQSQWSGGQAQRQHGCPPLRMEDGAHNGLQLPPPIAFLDTPAASPWGQQLPRYRRDAPCRPTELPLNKAKRRITSPHGGAALEAGRWHGYHDGGDGHDRCDRGRQGMRRSAHPPDTARGSRPDLE